MRLLKYIFFILLIFSFQKNYASAIILHAKDATAWLPQQTMNGELKNFYATTVIVHQNEKQFSVRVNNDKTFYFNLVLDNKKNKIWIEANDGLSKISSDTITMILGYHLLPVAEPFATIKNNKATLHINMLEATSAKGLRFHWFADKNNPAKAIIENKNDSVTKVFIPSTNGIYYFNLLVTAGKDSAKFQTFITKNSNEIIAFDLSKNHAAWIDSAIVYEISPSFFVYHGKYNDITQKLTEIKQLGINTIWLQPVFKSGYNDQGYDIIDYFSLRDDLGTEQQLQHLINTAKALHMRVLFDFVPNHTSINHPYAKDCAKYGTDSHYYNFYQHTNDGALYSSFYNYTSSGFIYYFWNGLVNLNYQNAEVQQWMIEACKYWVKKFDVDGYRFDAAWGVNARAPQFANKLQQELKSIKPDLFLLAEDKGAFESVYRRGFDAAYDWTADTSWVSQWSWQYNYSRRNNFNIFNYPDENKRSKLLRGALFNNGDSTHLRLRFLENNDLPRFIVTLGLERTKMAAALLFSLPGIPLIYNGQEIGFPHHPYSSDPIFSSNKTIQSLDKDSLFPYYQKLISLRQQYTSLRSKQMEEIAVTPSGSLFALHRWKNNEHFIVLINMSNADEEAHLKLSEMSDFDHSKKYILIDVLNNDTVEVNNNFFNVKVPVKAYSTRLLLLSCEKNYDMPFYSKTERLLTLNF